MGLHELGGDGEAQARSALPRHALERLEEMRAGLLRHAGAGVGDLDDGDRAFSPRDEEDLAGALAFALERLYGVAAEIAQDAVELVAVGIDLKLLLDLDGPVDEFGARKPEAVADLGDKRGEREALPP